MEGGYFFNSKPLATINFVPRSPPFGGDIPELNKILSELYAVNMATSAVPGQATPSSLIDGNVNGNSGVPVLDTHLEFKSPFSSNVTLSPPTSPAFSLGDPQSSCTSKPDCIMSSSLASSFGAACSTASPPNKKRKRVKPRMVDLPADVAKAKRESNRASARKCRERKRERQLLAMAQNSAVQKELQSLRTTVRVLTNLLAQRERMISELTSQHLVDFSKKNTFPEGLPV